MDISNMKNIVVLKNLPSNLVDEAIVVLKQNQKIKKYQYIDAEKSKNSSNNKKVESKDYIIKEAEMVISDYISKLEEKNKCGKTNINKIKNDYKKLKKINLFLIGTLLLSLVFNFII